MRLPFFKNSSHIFRNSLKGAMSRFFALERKDVYKRQKYQYPIISWSRKKNIQTQNYSYCVYLRALQLSSGQQLLSFLINNNLNKSFKETKIIRNFSTYTHEHSWHRMMFFNLKRVKHFLIHKVLGPELAPWPYFPFNVTSYMLLPTPMKGDSKICQPERLANAI